MGKWSTLGYQLKVNLIRCGRNICFGRLLGVTVVVRLYSGP